LLRELTYRANYYTYRILAPAKKAPAKESSSEDDSDEEEKPKTKAGNFIFYFTISYGCKTGWKLFFTEYAIFGNQLCCHL